jgi:hypothetical protein
MVSMSSGLMSFSRETVWPPVATFVPSVFADEMLTSSRLPTSLFARTPSMMSSGSFYSDNEFAPRTRMREPVPAVPLDCCT